MGLGDREHVAGTFRREGGDQLSEGNAELAEKFGCRSKHQSKLFGPGALIGR